MKNKKFLFIVTMLASFNLIETPIQAKMITSGTALPTSFAPSLLPALALYIGYNFLPREKDLVSEKFPYAQAWYDSLALKYPQANLNKIHFMQIPKSSQTIKAITDFAKKCIWISSYKHIFMEKESIKEINFLYKKVIDGYPLDEKEIGTLAGHEFTILYEAGHIKNNDAQTILASIGIMLGTAKCIGLYDKQNAPQTKDACPAKNNVIETTNSTKDKNSAQAQNGTIKDISIFPGFKDFLGTEWFKWSIPGTLTTIPTASFIAALVTILRYQSANADRFALETADLAALKEGLKSFESCDADPLHGIETTKISPYVKTDSFVGMFFQHLVGTTEAVIGFTQKQFFIIAKSTKPTRFLFDTFWSLNIINATPSMRAQAIKDEIAKREKTN